MEATGNSSAARWAIGSAAVDQPDAVAVLRDYMIELASRYYRRPATEAEIDAALADEPAHGLEAFLLARDRGRVVGCVGLRRLGPELGELTKVFVHPDARGQGGGARLLAAVEAAACGLGMTAVRLDTRADLVEARALYARHGYREIPAYNDSGYADHWFEKRLREAPVRRPAAS